MLSNQDPNGGGRTSRASNASGLSWTSGKTTHRARSSELPALAGPGVSSMLRTETETGGVGGGILDNLSGFGHTQRQTQRPRTSSRMSTASSISNNSSGANKHSRRHPSSSSVPRYPTAPNGPQYGMNVIPPAISKPTMPSSLDALGNQVRGRQRSRSVTHAMQPPYNLSSNKSVTSLPYAYGSHPQNPYVNGRSHSTGLRSMNPNHQLLSPVLGNNMGLGLRASQSLGRQRPSNSGYGQTHTNTNTGRFRNWRGKQNAGQGQRYRGLGNHSNIGQMGTRLPPQPSSSSLEERREQEDSFPPLFAKSYERQLEDMYSGNSQLRRNRLPGKLSDQHAGVPPFPANHQQRIAVEQALLETFVPGFDVPSSGVTSPRIPKDSRLIEVSYKRGGTEARLSDTSSKRLIAAGEKIPVVYYDYSEQFHGDGYVERDTGFVPTGFVDQAKTITEKSGPTKKRVRWKSDFLVTQEVQPTQMAIASPEVEGKSICRSTLPQTKPCVRTQKFSDGQSLKSCADILDKPLVSASNILLEQDKCLMDPDACSLSAAKVAASSDRPVFALPFRPRSSNPGTAVMNKSRNNPEAPADVSGESREPQRVYGAISSSTPPLASHLRTGLWSGDQGDLLKSDRTAQSVPQFATDSNLIPAVKDASMSLSAADIVKPVEKVPPKPRMIGSDAPAVGDSYNVFDNNPDTAIYQHNFNNTSSGIPEPLSVYSIQGHSLCSLADSCGHVLPVVEANAQNTPSHQLNSGGSYTGSAARAPLMDTEESRTTDLRFARYRQRTGSSHYLPDLKEESHEGSNSRLKFDTSSSIRASDGNRISFSTRASIASRRRGGTDSNVGNAFAQPRGLPSMQFSRIDLFDDLNDSVGLRHSCSAEGLPRVSQRLGDGSPPRPASAAEGRRLRIPLAESRGVEIPSLSMQPAAMMSSLDLHCARSSELVAEVERMTIPSVGGLTQRFSEWVPSLRKYFKHSESAESLVEGKGQGIRPTQKRSSAHLRAMFGAPHMVVIEDDAYDELAKKEKEKEKQKKNDMPKRSDDSGAAVDASGANSIEEKLEKGKGVAVTQTQHKTAPLSELRASSSAALRPRSNALSLQAPRHSEDSVLSSRRSLGSFVSTPKAAEARPWISDKNYPWATSTNTPADISLPPHAAIKSSPHPEPSHIPNRFSEASSASAFSTAQTATASFSRLSAYNAANTGQHHFDSFGRISDQPHEAGERYPTSSLSPPTAIFRDHFSGSDISEGEHYDTTRRTRFSLLERFSAARKITLHSPTKTRVRRSKVEPQDITTPESARAPPSSAKVNSHTFRNHLQTWWDKSSHLICQITTGKHSTTTTD
jgi:hypothetical protein